MTELMANYYWLGVGIALIVIYCAIWIYKTILTNPYEYKNNPLVLLFLVFGFLSWYAIMIIGLTLIVGAIIGLIVWVFKSVFHDFFDNDGNM